MTPTTAIRATRAALCHAFPIDEDPLADLAHAFWGDLSEKQRGRIQCGAMLGYSAMLMGPLAVLFALCPLL